MSIRDPFSVDEWYHCFNRGIDKRIVFENERDYDRFVQLLYLTNSDTPIHRSDMHNKPTEEFFGITRGAPLVSIGAFCLMSNHFHLLLKEIAEGGISRFMQKLGTAYTMYFNIKRERTGNLLAKPFRSRHVGEDDYFQHVLQYIHCNPAEMYEAGWKRGVVKNLSSLEKRLIAYPYSSFGAHLDKKHPYHAILSNDVFDIAVPQRTRKMLKETAEYYEEISNSLP